MLLLPTNQTTLLVNVQNSEHQEAFGTLQTQFQKHGKLKKLLF